MKKSSLLLLFVCSPFFLLLSQLTYVPDDDFEQYIEMYIPNASDGIQNNDYVFTAALKAANSITLQTGYGFEVADFTGIEDFDTLQTLHIDGHLMTNLDLSHIVMDGTMTTMSVSYNTFLQDLKLPQGTYYQSIVYSNPSLTDLEFSTNSFIRSLSLYNNSSLDSLEMSNISGVVGGGVLNITSNTNLEYCNLKNSYCILWGSVIFTSNPSLYCIIVDDPSYSEIASSWSWSERSQDPTVYNYTLSGTATGCDGSLGIENNYQYQDGLETVKTYDLLGREINNPSTGQVVIDIMSDGSRVKKVIGTD